MNAVNLFSVSDVVYAVGVQTAPYFPDYGRLIYALSGSVIYIVNGTLFPVKAGECFWLPPGVANFHIPIEKEKFHARVFRFQINDSDLRNRLSRTYAPIKSDVSTKPMLDYLNKYWNVDREDNMLRITAFSVSILSLFFIDQIQFSKTSIFITTHHYTPATQSVLWFIENNISSVFSMDNLSKSLGYNKKYLSSAFKQDTGLSIMNYKNFHRIRLAIVFFFFWNCNYSIAETCHQLRFSSLSYFSGVFKAFTGVTPRVFYHASARLSPETRTQIAFSEPLLARQRVSIDVLLASMRHLGQIMEEFFQSESL